MKKLFTLLALLVPFWELNAQCTADFDISFIECDSVWFNALETSPGIDHSWSFGDGTTSLDADPLHMYTSNGTYTVYHIVYDSLAGCLDSAIQTVVVACADSCSLDLTSYVYTDTVDCMTHLTALATGGSGDYSYAWDFGDGSSGTGCCPSHYYPDGTYTASITVTDSIGCVYSEDFSFTVLCDTITYDCDASFTVDDYYCDSLWFTPITTTGINHTWYYGDGTFGSSTYGFHTYATNGDYTVTHTVYDSLTGCTDTYSLLVSVDCPIDSCVLDVTAYAYTDSSECITYLNASVSGGTGGYTYTWDFGDGSSATGCCPVHSYDTGFWLAAVTVTDSTGCESIDEVWFYADCDSTTEVCDASFTIDDYYCDSLWFMPTMTSGVGHSWSFGDGTTATSTYANHAYLSDGTYTVTHTVYDSLTSCWDTYTQTITIDCSTDSCDLDLTTYAYTDSIDCMTYLTAYVTGGTGAFTFNWSLGDGSFATGCCPTHYYSPGIYTATLTVTDTTGCSSTENVTVYAYCDSIPSGCDASFIIDDFYCDSIWFSPSMATGVGHYWDFGDGVTSMTTFPTHTYSTEGTYVVTHTVYDSIAGCYAVYTDSITIDCGTLSLGEDELEVTVYPVPTYGWIKIATEENMDFYILDVNGRILMTGNTMITQEVDLSEYADGFYIIQFIYYDTVIMKKIQKQ